MRSMVGRRFGVVIVGILAAVSCATACTSSSVGGGVSGSVTSDESPAGTGSAASASSVSAPVSVPLGASGTAAGSQFCTEFRSGDLGSLYDTSKAAQTVQLWDRLTADAPAEIQGDMKTVDAYLHTITGGNAPPPGADVATAVQHISSWVVDNCA